MSGVFKISINPNTNPNPVYSYTATRDNIFNVERNIILCKSLRHILGIYLVLKEPFMCGLMIFIWNSEKYISSQTQGLILWYKVSGNQEDCYSPSWQNLSHFIQALVLEERAGYAVFLTNVICTLVPFNESNKGSRQWRELDTPGMYASRDLSVIYHARNRGGFPHFVNT
jgi:hypothetical protein